MSSVTNRIKEIQQPYGGYLPIKMFSKVNMNDGIELFPEENIHSSLVGLAVDYLTRYSLGDSAEDAFIISALGAAQIGKQDEAMELMSAIKGLDNDSITAACKLSGFDVCFRSSIAGYKPIEDINPNLQTIDNIRTMVNRSMSFWKQYGPVVKRNLTFEGGYTDTVQVGDGDFATKDTLWDFKVSKSAPTSKHSLQILMYYIMGCHSIHDYFKDIKKIGFYNPRLNVVYVCDIESISSDVIKAIEDDVICYNHKHQSAKLSSDLSNAPSPVSDKKSFYSVADICNLTGCKKSEVYSDIRMGNLKATKKGNKYVVDEQEYKRYLEYIKAKQKSVAIAALAIGGIFFVGLLIYLIWIFNMI